MVRKVSLKQAIRILKNVEKVAIDATFDSTKELRDDLKDSILDGTFAAGGQNEKWAKQKDKIFDALPHRPGVRKGVDGVLTGNMAYSMNVSWNDQDVFNIGCAYTPHWSSLKGNTDAFLEQEHALKEIEETIEYDRSMADKVAREYKESMAKKRYNERESRGMRIDRVGDTPADKFHMYPAPGGMHQYSESWSGVHATAKALDMPLLIMFLQKYDYLKESWLEVVGARWAPRWKENLIKRVKGALGS